jgi:hypothetical protein
MQPDNERIIVDRLNILEQQNSKMGNRIDKIFDVVVGNEQYGQVGIIARIVALEKDKTKNEALRNKLIGASIAGGAIWTLVVKAIEHLAK